MRVGRSDLVVAKPTAARAVNARMTSVARMLAAVRRARWVFMAIPFATGVPNGPLFLVTC